MEKKTKKKIAPIISTVLVILFSLAYVVTFVLLAVEEIIIVPLAVVFIVVYLIVCVGVITALRERIKEINGGLEDATFKY